MPHMVVGSGATRTSYSTSCSSRRIGHLFVEAREHMNSEFGIFECMRRMPASLCLNLQWLSSECLKPGVGIWPNVLNLGFTSTTAIRMMFHTYTLVVCQNASTPRYHHPTRHRDPPHFHHSSVGYMFSHCDVTRGFVPTARSIHQYNVDERTTFTTQE